MSDLVYRVIAGGTHIQALRHVRSTANGWHRYRIEAPDPMAGHEFSTREWFHSATPIAAVMQEMVMLAARMGLLARCARRPGTHADLVSKWLLQVEEAAREHRAAAYLLMTLLPQTTKAGAA